MSFKKCKVVMLPTNEKAVINLNEYRKDIPTLCLSKDISNYNTNPFQLIKDRGYQPQHLYILSDEEIKEGDWYLTFQNNEVIGQPRKCEDSSYNFINCKKIIVTTDKSLTIDGYDTSDEDAIVKLYLPQPSQSFIEKYVEEYNKGNVITEVMVEYELGNISESYFDGEKEKLPLHLKINPDNTINIKPIKDSWNIKELSGILSMYKQYIFSKTGRETEILSADKWIESNLF